MPFLLCSPAPSSVYRVLLPRWILLVMSFLPSARLISPMCLVDCTSSISCLPSVHVCVCLFLPPLTMITSLFVELMVTLSLLVSLCTICNACCRSSGWYEIRANIVCDCRTSDERSSNFGSNVVIPKNV